MFENLFKNLFFPANQTETLSTVIDPPRNFSIKDYQINSNTMNVTLSWQKPDFPVTGYKVRILFQLKIDDINFSYQIFWESENDQSSMVNSIDISSLEFTIPYLLLDKTYLFKVCTQTQVSRYYFLYRSVQ